MTTPQDQTQVSSLVQAIQTEIDRIQQRLAVYKNVFDKDPMHFLENNADRFAAKTQTLKRLQLLSKAIESGKRTEPEALQYFYDKATESLIDWSPAHSTSAIHNLIQECVREGDREFREMVEGFISEFGGNDKA